MKLLFIGRFQPFHKGHLEIIQKVLKDDVKLIICIGSAQHSYTKRNPFTYCEREHMIKLSLKEYNIKSNNISIIPLPDIHDKENWVNYVIKVVQNFDTIVTNSPETEDLFSKKGYSILNVPIKYDGLCGTLIRDKIAKHNNLWKYGISNSIIGYIKKIKGDKRIRDIYGRMGNKSI